jgi:hypothetical protein
MTDAAHQQMIQGREHMHASDNNMLLAIPEDRAVVGVQGEQRLQCHTPG